MSRSAPRRVPHHPSLPPSPPSLASSSRSLPKHNAMADAYLGSLKSLTPQRKHHKLLKDGNEVWSEEVEKIFVQGLREYWESPWATYSRGRSRWRNQFLVDHLKKKGIDRSKKQVASHIQVLRNMWRGEPEFHLVAGGEELFQEDGLLASPKKAGTPSTPGSGSELADDQASASSTPSSLVDEFPSHFSSHIPLPQFTPHEDATLAHHLEHPTGPSPSSLALPYSYAPPSPPTARNRMRPAAVKLEPLHMHPGLFNLPQSPQGTVSDNDLSPLFPPYPHSPHVRVLTLTLWAEGMPPFVADISRLNATMPISSRNPQATSILIRVKMGISSIDDLHSSPNLHGFQAAITFSDGWSSEAKCITKSCVGSDCVNQEIGYLEANSTQSSVDLQPRSITSILPESSLTRCKWLPLEQDNITQQIAIDGVIVAAFVYHIERTMPGSPPSVELVDFQKYKPQRRGTSASQHLVSPPLSAPLATSPISTPPNFHPPNTAFGGPIMPMEFGANAGPQPHPNASLVESFPFDPHLGPAMYRTDAPLPQITATSSASVIYSSPR